MACRQSGPANDIGLTRRRLFPQDLMIREFRKLDSAAFDAFASRLERPDIGLRFGALSLSADYFLPKDPAGTAFAAVDGGCAILGILNLEPLNAEAIEMALIVRSDRKRRGIGRALVARAIRWAEARGLSEMIAYIQPENGAAVALVREAGFQGVARIDLFIAMRRLLAKREPCEPSLSADFTRCAGCDELPSRWPFSRARSSSCMPGCSRS